MFLNKLKELLQVESAADFSRACEKRPSNMSKYLTSRKDPGPSVLEDCLLNAAIWRIFDSPPSVNTRLGKKVKSLREGVMESAISNLFGQEIRTFREVEPIPEARKDLPISGGVYILYDSAGNVLYIGKAKSFRAEVWQTLDREIPVGMRFGPNMRKSKPTIWNLASYMSLYEIKGSIRESYVFVIDCLERQEVGLWTSGVSRCGFRRRAG